MGSGQHSHFVRQSLLYSLQVVLFESFIKLDDLRCHNPDHPSEMSVASLRDLSFPIDFPRLVEGRIEPYHGNHLFMTFKLLNVSTDFDQKIHCALLPNSLHRGKDISISLNLPFGEFGEDIRKLLEMLLQLHPTGGVPIP